MTTTEHTNTNTEDLHEELHELKQQMAVQAAEQAGAQATQAAAQRDASFPFWLWRTTVGSSRWPAPRFCRCRSYASSPCASRRRDPSPTDPRISRRIAPSGRPRDSEVYMRRLPAVALVAVALAVPGQAAADVFVKVPTRFLGGPIWTPLPASSPQPSGRPSMPPAPSSDACRGAAPGDCVVIGPQAETDSAPLPGPGPGGVGTPVDDVGVESEPAPEEDTPEVPDDGQVAQEVPAMPAVPPTPADLAAAFGGLLSPGAADWLAWQRPVLRWRARPGAGHYNVQIFRGEHRVMNAWTRATRLRVSRGVLRQGRSYVWAVWPGSGPRAAPRYDAPIGRSTFAVTLRPRIVFRTPGTGRGTVAEVRPHIPFATLRLTRPADLSRRVPNAVTLDRRGRFALPISPRAAERLGAILTDRGPLPPVGLRGPGL